MKPEYYYAAKLLKQGTVTIPLGWVDASVETDLAAQFGIDGYPTLKVFRKGRAWTYTGPRTATSISQYMQASLNEPSREFRAVKDWLTAQSQEDITVLGLFESDTDPLIDTYFDAGFEYRHEYTFTHSFAIEEFRRQFPEARAPCVVLVHPPRFVNARHEKTYHVYTGSPSDEKQYKPDDEGMDAVVQKNPKERAKRALKSFLDRNAVPLVGQFTKRNAHSHFSAARRRPLCVFFFTVDWSYDHREATQRWRTTIAEKVAVHFRDVLKSNVTFAIASEDEFADSILTELRAGSFLLQHFPPLFTFCAALTFVCPI